VSRPGFGASFWVELPAPSVEGGEAPPLLEGLRVAMLSPSNLLTQATRALVNSLGAEFVEGNAAPDVLLLDWTEAAEAGDWKRIHARAVIALIPQERRDLIAHCRAAGVEHYTLKPVRRRSLAHRIKAALSASGGEIDESRFERAPNPDALRDLRVLLAEDNPINALLARTLLARAGCIVTAVQNGAEAVAAASASAFDLILLDIRMPQLDGFEAAERIRASGGPCASAAIVALTADTGDGERVRAMLAGMDDFIAKPIDAPRLIAVAERFTRRTNPASV